MGTHSGSLAWKIPEQRSLAGYSPWGHKELDKTEQLNICVCVCVCVYIYIHTHTHICIFSGIELIISFTETRYFLISGNWGEFGK